MLKCKGCGEILQNTNKDLPGYTPKLDVIDTESLLCQRCFRMLHYGEFKQVKINNKVFKDFFNEIKTKDCEVLYIIDVFNLYASLIDDINKLTGKNNIRVVVNKCDLLPHVNTNKLLKYVMNVLDEHHISFSDIYLCSAAKKDHIDDIIAEMQEYKKDIYVVGRSNVGKSTFINALNKAIMKDGDVSTAYFAGTTLKTIKIPFLKPFIYDTPGLDNESSIYHDIDLKNLHKLCVQEEIKPISMSIYPDDCLMIGSLGYIVFDVKEKTNIVLYGSRYINYHKTSNEDIKTKFNEFKNDKNSYPKLINQNNKLKEFKTKLNEKRISIVLNGVCWIDLLNFDGEVKIFTPDYLGINIVKSLFGGK